VGYIITTTHTKCRAGIDLVKKMDMEGFLDFKSRIVDTFKLNNILDGNEALQDILADIFTYAYAITSKQSWKIFADRNAAENVANAVYSATKKIGLKFKDEKINKLFVNVLITVFTKLDRGKK
jgi:hypothetical protein